MDQSAKLCDLKCGPCRGGIPPLTLEEIMPLAAQVPDWKLAEDGLSISRGWKFKNFQEAQMFVHRVEDLAEKEGHHPDFAHGWGYVTLKLWTHAIRGLSQNDFVLAAKIDQLPTS